MRLNDDNDIIAGFHVNLTARNRYRFTETLFAPNGKTTIHNFHTARIFAQQMNHELDLITAPEQAVYAGQINAVALIHGITQYLFKLYCEQQNPQILHLGLNWITERLGAAAVDKTLSRLIHEFPPLAVQKGQITEELYLTGSTEGRPNKEIVLEELLMLWLSNANPAFTRFFELFGDDSLEEITAYNKLIAELYQFFDYVATLPPVKKSNFPVGENIVYFLLAPVRAHPYSLEGQLAYILEQWGTLIGSYIFRLLRGLDLIKEENKPIFGGPGPAEVITFNSYGAEFEAEAFTPDKEWMPTLVLIAKNAYVWLDQLSRKYGRLINRLDQIPDSELDILASWGFTGLWLIGLWERSKASQVIKQRMGNPEAVASAYSLLDYHIAADLGGDEACNDLKRRAWRRGIRLASDMVPNHVGLDGKWVVEHPDWFISLNHPPFPNYTFNGENLSWDGRIGIYLEDHYYNKSDAAVVFKRVDHWTGDTRYIYHGNDGTTMPWNDTAQLNYLHPDVREAMIQTILYIARQFPIIRFDAAMTLVKRHFQRLWFPEPGSGGAIPSRAEYGMTKADFEALMPQEFWREVVDRAAIEAPDTLLLAEAFWLMEGYFVRTLGMHRVYNSAFMNMLRDEENGKYRTVMKNTLEFDPEVLRRYVNFMNNPDERTAIDQFGSGDKYVGICLLMVTMPGVPMFGHGQIEGFAERYGMEYRRAYWDETPDANLIARHEREIFPIMRRRYLFGGVENFLMYDFFTTDGGVNDNIFAYSNGVGEERGLMLYHNCYGTARGWIKMSVTFSQKTGQGDERTLVQRSLAEGLRLQPDSSQYCIFREHRSGLEYIRNSQEIWDRGLYIELNAYEHQIFIDFRTVAGDYHYAQLAAELNGRGVPSIDEAVRELYFAPIREPFKLLVNAAMFKWLLDLRELKTDHSAVLDEVELKLGNLLHSIEQFTGETLSAKEDPADEIANILRNKLAAILEMTPLTKPEIAELPAKVSEADLQNAQRIQEMQDTATWAGLLSWLFVHGLGQIADSVDSEDAAIRSRSWIDEWLLGKIIVGVLVELGIDNSMAQQTLHIIKIMTTHQILFAGDAEERADQLLTALLQDNEVQSFLGMNRYQGVLWFNRESFDHLLNWLTLMAELTALQLAPEQGKLVTTARAQVVEAFSKAASASDYHVDKLIEAVSSTGKKGSKNGIKKESNRKLQKS